MSRLILALVFIRAGSGIMTILRLSLAVALLLAAALPERRGA